MLNSSAKILIAEIEKSGKRLNDYELGFFYSIKTLTNKGSNLSDKQGKSLEKLYARSQGHTNFVARQRK